MIAKRRNEIGIPQVKYESEIDNLGMWQRLRFNLNLLEIYGLPSLITPESGPGACEVEVLRGRTSITNARRAISDRPTHPADQSN